MRNAWIVCRRELGSYFTSPIAWLLVTMYSLIFGYFFWNFLGQFVLRSMELQMLGQAAPTNINEEIIRPLLANASFLGIFFIPLISMRLFAEEKRNGTIELLTTSPVRDMEVIVGKWFAATILYGWLLLYSGISFCFLFIYGHPDWKPLAVAYLGLILQGAALLALGTFISTLTRNQIVAGAGTFAACLLLWVFAWVSSYNAAGWAGMLSYLSIITHYESFGRGVLSSKDGIYYLSVIFVGLFFTARSLESLRWRS
ncbi:MAG: ABC transporter permease subunit [Acidobacteriaceae bacterium]